MRQNNHILLTGSGPEAEPVSTKKRTQLLSLISYLSGCCGLAYEVLYNRILSNIFGDSFTVGFATLFTFLLGIAIGYLLAHKLKRWLYAVEICLGLYAIITTFLMLKSESFTSDLFLFVFPLDSHLSLGYAIGFMLIPSVLVGISIPVLSRYLVIQKDQSPFDKVYLFYNLGAGSTILIIEFILLQYLPISQTLYLVGGVNLAVGIALFFLRAIYKDERPHPITLKIIDSHTIGALFLFSMVSASYQLLLLKINTFVFGPFRENFSLTLFIAVIYVSVGTYLQIKRHISFKALLCLGILVILSEMALFKASTFALSFAMSKWGHILPFTILLKIVWVGFWGLPLVIFGMGIPVLLKSASFRHIENASGVLLFYSSLANALGFALMFFFIHPLFTYGSMFVALAIVLALAVWLTRGFSKPFVAATLILLSIALFLWDEKMVYISHSNFSSPWSLKGACREISRIEPFKAFNQTLAVIHNTNGRKSFFINGYHSIYLDGYIEKLAGAIPLLINPEADNALVLGLGSGILAGATSRVVQDLDVVEINKAVVDNARRFSEYNDRIYEKKNVHIALDDGIRFLKRSHKQYDIIINSVTTPLYFSSSKLYTKDFFHIVKRRLSERGIYYTWFDGRCGDEGSFILIKTLLDSFKHVGIISLKSEYFLLFASDRPFPTQEVRNTELIKSLTTVVGAPHFIDLCLLSRDIANDKTFRYTDNVSLNTIDYPALEYKIARIENSPSFTEVKKWVQQVTSFYEDPLTRKPFLYSELRRKYLYYSLFIPYLALPAKHAAGASKELTEERDATLVLWNVDGKKIDPGFLKEYLTNRRKHRLEANTLLLKTMSFQGKDFFAYDLMLQNSRVKECSDHMAIRLQTSHENAYYHALIGVCQINTGQARNGIEQIETALRLKPNLSRFRLYVAAVYLLTLGDEERARTHLEYFKSHSWDFEIMDKIASLNKRLNPSIHFTSQPLMEEVAREALSTSRNASSWMPDYDFLFYDILTYFYPES